MNAAWYRRFRHASARLAHTEREERRSWSMSEYVSSLGNRLLNSKRLIAASNAFLYTSNSRCDVILMARLLPFSPSPFLSDGGNIHAAGATAKVRRLAPPEE